MRNNYFCALCVVLVIVFSRLVASPPPEPKTVYGTVYMSDEVTQAPSGTDIMINNTNLSQVTYAKTYGPPTQTGRYSAVILASEGDLIYVRAWNATQYGYNTGTMGPTRVNVDITLNISRPSETNVTITVPQDHSFYNMGADFNVTAFIQVLGNNGLDCNATISFSNSSVIVLFSGENNDIDLGNILLWDSVTVVWNVTANQTGFTNIAVDASCGSDGINLEGLNSDTVINISSSDYLAPNITLIAPENNTRQNNPVVFYYNVTDGSPIMNCSLIVDNVIVATTPNPLRNALLNFTQTISTKNNWWAINCTDSSSSHNTGSAGFYNLTINSFPSVSVIDILDPIDLFAASARTIICNGTIFDEDGYPDIANVNATLFNIDYGSYHEDSDNNSIHYTDTSCTIYNQVGNMADFNCSFDVVYYALNGSWVCNVTVGDLINASNSSEVYATVNELLAIGADPSFINYGDLGITEESPMDLIVNITNYGNILLDLELYGYAIDDNDGLAMNCTKSNISVDWERFDLDSGTDYALMTALQNKSSPNSINFNLPPRTEIQESAKETYWKLKIPELTGGICNGKIVFTAVPD
ncbi:hypothetical protein JW930_07160 [Candidatus Woesearchaeota archaeon]|nr:hypothetical protein [Candidatus Woesearchaeota archaeon]